MMTLVLAALGAKAAPADWSYTVEVDGESVTYTGKYDIAHDKVRIEVNEPGGLAVFINQSKNEDPALKGICADNAPIILEIESKNCSLIADDFSALNTSTTPALSHFESLSFGKVTVESISTMSGLSMSGVKFLRLPDGFTSAADLSSMSGFKTANPLLQAVGSYKKGENNNRKNELTIHSFQENSMLGLKNVMKPEFGEAKIVTLSGIYGDMDLNSSTNGGSSLVFNGLPAKWDLSKATFTTCTPRWGVEFANNSHYYAIDDPFEEHPENAKTSLTPEDMANTNAFFYFNGYGKAVVEITFPENITELPPYCLEQLCNDNKENYKILKGMSEEDFKATYGNNATCVPMENLVIPASVATVGYECAYNTHIKKITFGNGLKEVQGGAFKQVQGLEDIEFSAGISNCYLGHDAFQLCYDVKHIVLCEGIVSLGAGCFQNSQQMESIRLPETLKYIGNRAFQNNLALASITIPPNVVKIGKGAFVRTPLTDVYLTTTDPNKIPYMYTAGTGWVDNNELDCSFGFDALWGFNTYPNNESDVSGLTWDQAAAYYYANCNCMAVLHYPEQLHDRLWAGFDYSYTSSDNYGLPNQTDGRERGGTGGDLPYYNIADADGKGVFSRDGWAQFVLQKDYKADSESEVFTKEYDDVWYTICFPFDLTDEQLAVAFNEGYNIVDFSSIQILDPDQGDDVENKTLLLHFNKVADTEYRDERERVYVRQLGSDNKPIREKDGDFEYNVYTGPDGETYKHVQVGTNGDKYKTKTFAINGNLNNPIVMIEGYLASAGHPYMVHPNLGIAFGDPKSRCNFSGIKWLSESERISKYEERKRKIDLGVEKTTDNYNQDDYSGYGGQEYEFVGNWREYNPGVEIPTKPVLPVTKPTPPDKPLSAPMVVADPGPEPANPGNVTLTANEKVIYKRLTKGQDSNTGPWKNETSITAEYGDNSSSQWNSYNSNAWLIQNLPTDDTNLPELLPYGNDTQKEATFDYCKALFNRYKKVEIYKSWQTKKAAYDQYLIDQAYYDEWSADDGASLNQQYLDDLAAYNDALDYYNKNDLKTWKSNVANMEGFVVIPKDAYFLGRKTGEYPKYYREVSNNPKRSTGLWTQFSAIVKPNTTAVNGLEAELDGKAAQAKGYNMAFDEDFFVINDEPQGITTLIEKIEKEEGKADVQYMDIVVSIDGKVISRDKTNIEGLPKGIYIINGRKYYVK